jgi:hypothetical protein
VAFSHSASPGSAPFEFDCAVEPLLLLLNEPSTIFKKLFPPHPLSSVSSDDDDDDDNSPAATWDWLRD